jgi:hypothetical protein
MEEEKKKLKLVKMPEPIHIKRIHSKLDFFSEKNIIRQWPGYDIIDTLFYLYLFNKYKNNCLIKHSGIISYIALGLELHIRVKVANRKIYKDHLLSVSKQLSECIGRNLNSIVIPLYLKGSNGGHANLLIYRKNDHTIEHFEPHGAYYSLSTNNKINKLIDIRLNEFMSILNKQLKKINKPPVKLIPSNDVCPVIKGLQALEESSTKQKLPLEGKGYCAAWSMFFTELALKNPTIPSNELLNIIYNKLDKDPEKQSNYLRQVITGYINLIYDKIEKYFYFITGTQGKIDNIIEMFKKGNYRDILFDFSSIINIQNALLNDPSLTKKRYLEILEYRKMKTMNPNEIKELDREIDILNRMELLLSPSPVSSLSKTKSKTKAKSKTRSKKTNKLSKTKKVIHCPEGSKINPITGRCNKIKVYPPCPPTRDPITHRCKRIE